MNRQHQVGGVGPMSQVSSADVMYCWPCVQSVEFHSRLIALFNPTSNDSLMRLSLPSAPLLRQLKRCLIMSTYRGNSCLNNLPFHTRRYSIALFVCNGKGDNDGTSAIKQKLFYTYISSWGC